ncbi:hypothetical protein F2P81_024355 [Scophthalmus maximus]|uniref:Uncharacterized protein n=1 Tax=Scophthalmus maximus TaxID=52904 RepID=A0A6A4RU19_SCOMX|nr:hypothetical protein F2P81_024355 [Scophthalmus maximus]
MSHRMLNVCDRNDSVKAADLRHGNKLEQGDRRGKRFKAPQNPGSAVTSTTSISGGKKNSHQSSGIDPLGEGKAKSSCDNMNQIWEHAAIGATEST